MVAGRGPSGDLLGWVRKARRWRRDEAVVRFVTTRPWVSPPVWIASLPGGGSTMRRVIVDEWMTLDGVAQAPGEKNEDTTGGFQYGGWHMDYVDEAFMSWMLANLHEAGGFLLGRRTYEGFAAHWPNASEEEQPVAEPLNKGQKYVASRTLREPLEWQNSSLLRGDAGEAVAALKREDGGDLHVIGSTNLVRTLIENDLVDEFRLIIDPVVVGGGKRIFHDDGELRSLRLVESEVTSKGSFIARYAV
jgi:dihydrofolate reductase